MSSNIFNGRRFALLFRQHFVHNSKLLLFSSVAYVGVVFTLLTVVQLGSELHPHDIGSFRGFMVAFVAIFGVLYTGYAFPAFRAKESTMNYLLLPSSALEKFAFEVISRIGIMLLLLPLLFWVTFNLQGYFFSLFSKIPFDSIGIHALVDIKIPGGVDSPGWFMTMITGLGLLLFVVPFTGAAMFSKQPLIKTLFAVALIIIFYASAAYVAAEPMGLSKYNPGESMWLIPLNEHAAFRFFAIAVIIANAVMLFVAYRKLKEREV